MLTVYIAGVIYFNGCDEDVKRVYAPDGTTEQPPCYTSLFISSADIEDAETSWWPGFRHPVDSINAIEFRIPQRATISFPDAGNAVGCVDLDDGLSKLKKVEDGSEVDFQVDPDNAQTIADVTINGGVIRARRYKNIGLVEWAIADSGTRRITVTTTGESRTITVRNPSVVVLTNMPETSVRHAGASVALYKKLNPSDADATLVAKKPQGSVGQVDDNDILAHIRPIVDQLGDTPSCCRPQIHHK